jgi:cell division protein FtsQ
MPAAVRTPSQGHAKPRRTVAPKLAKARTSAGAPGPSKLRAANHKGISPALLAPAACLVAALVLAAVLATGGRGESIVNALRQANTTRLASVGFRLDTIHLQGATPAAQGDILKAAAVPLGAAILTLDLSAIRARVERVGWVEHARVIRLLPDTLVIAVEQRPLIAVWEHAGKTVLVVSNGAAMPKIDAAQFSGLPLIVGDGANTAAASILKLLAPRQRLVRHIDALVRVDARRWDLRLKDGGLIMLPATGEDDALKRFDQLDSQARILDLGFARIDLRDPEMVVVRPRDIAGPVVKSDGV